MATKLDRVEVVRKVDASLEMSMRIRKKLKYREGIYENLSLIFP